MQRGRPTERFRSREMWREIKQRYQYKTDKRQTERGREREKERKLMQYIYF